MKRLGNLRSGMRVGLTAEVWGPITGRAAQGGGCRRRPPRGAGGSAVRGGRSGRCPPRRGGRSTLSRPRYCCWKSRLAVVMPSSEKPRLRAMATVLRKTSGMTTALPRLSQTPAARAGRPGRRGCGSRPARRGPSRRRRAAGTCGRCRCRRRRGPSPARPPAGPRPAGWRPGRGRRAPGRPRPARPPGPPPSAAARSQAAAKSSEVSRAKPKVPARSRGPTSSLVWPAIGELQVVDRRRPVHRHAGQDAPRDPVAQIRPAARLDHVAADRGQRRAGPRRGPRRSRRGAASAIAPPGPRGGHRAGLPASPEPLPGRPRSDSRTLLGRSDSGSKRSASRSRGGSGVVMGSLGLGGRPRPRGRRRGTARSSG